MHQITSAYVARETDRRLRRFDLRLGDEVRRLRSDAGITLAALGRAVGVDPAHLGRIERGLARPSIDLLMRLGVALGADLSLRFFAGIGPRLHDRFQAPMVEALLNALHPRWTARVEVPVGDPARGVVDAVLDDGIERVSVVAESCSEISRLEQVLRWSADKADQYATRSSSDPWAGGEGRRVSRLLVVRSTRQNREIARRYRATLTAAYPARTHDAVAALTSGSVPWPGPSIVWMRTDGNTAALLPFPPRGVDAGR
jgi:transcriptional regulator with XRE-family HTH domain